MEINDMRNNSWNTVSSMGLPTNYYLPVIDQITEIPPPLFVANRFWCLYACVACAYGFDKTKALAWLEREQAKSHLSPIEIDFLSNNMDPMLFRQQIEALWTLGWAYGLVPSLNFNQPCSDQFITLLPDLKKNQPTAAFVRSMKPRSPNEIMEAQDLAYCLHWAIIECQLKNVCINLNIQPHVIIERRRALDWLTDPQDWYDMVLDT